MRSSLRLLAFVALLFASPLGADAYAKGGGGGGDIQKMGIKSFDTVFSRADSIDDRLDKAQARRKSARKQVSSALNLSEKTTFSKSLQELRSRGQGKVKLAMKGTTPTLQAADALPNNVRSAVSAVNSAMNDYTALLSDLAGVPAEARALTREVKTFPKKFKKELGNALSLSSLTSLNKRAVQAKKLKSNLQVTASLPKTANAVVKGLRSDIQAVINLFKPR